MTMVVQSSSVRPIRINIPSFSCGGGGLTSIMTLFAGQGVARTEIQVQRYPLLPGRAAPARIALESLGRHDGAPTLTLPRKPQSTKIDQQRLPMTTIAGLPASPLNA